MCIEEITETFFVVMYVFIQDAIDKNIDEKTKKSLVFIGCLMLYTSIFIGGSSSLSSTVADGIW